MASKKIRLDQAIHAQYPSLSKSFIQSIIMQNKVKVNGMVQSKPGTSVDPDSHFDVDLQEPSYVSRAGLKLEAALDSFHIDVTGMVVLDAGLSTGGFSDCLLQRGARKIYGIDVGYGQVHEKIRHDPYMVIMERTNLRNMPPLPEKVDLVTLDLSFISVLKVLPNVLQSMKPDGQLIVLIKPQFEAEKGEVGKGGVIRDEKKVQKIVKKVIEGIEHVGFVLKGVIPSPIKGMKGNQEFLAYFMLVN